MATAFEVKGCLGEGCQTLKYVDRTGWWSAQNPMGYWNPANGTSPNPDIPTLTSLGVFGYDSYSIDIYAAVFGGVNMDSSPPPTPSYTFNLLTETHTIDTETGYVTWEWTLETLGIEYIRPGWWLVRGTAVWTEVDTTVDTYLINGTSGLQGYLTEQVDKMMLAANPKKCGGCAKGCADPYELYLIYNPLTCWSGNCQDEEGYTTHIDYLLNEVPPCPC